MLEERVRKLLVDALNDRPDLFLIEYHITGSNQIRIVLDGDQGVSLDDCIEVSRKIEHQLDRESEDFSLEVGSTGASAPLEQPRQYLKHVGRDLSLRLKDGSSLEAQLDQVGKDRIRLSWTAREPKPVGKGKVDVSHVREVEFNEIELATVILKF